jgi:hypothetical protein
MFNRFERVVLATLMAAVSITTATSAHAAGAFVLGKTPEVRSGSYGWSADFPNEGEAKYAALNSCLTTGEPAQVRAACRLRKVFNNECFGFAWDPSADQGDWAVAGLKATAVKDAIDKCNALPSGAGRCVLVVSTCDTVGPGAPAVASAPSTTAPISLPVGGPAQAQSGNGSTKALGIRP